MQPLCEKTSTRRRGVMMTDKETAAAKAAFLQDYATSGTILHACRVANVHRCTVYRWLEKDEAFSIKYHQVQQDFSDVVLGEVMNRAIEGFYQPVVSMGKIVYQQNGEPLMERVVSDKLLAILLKRHHPEYRENYQIAVNQQSNAHEMVIDTRQLTNEQLAQLKAIAVAMKGQEA